MGRINYIICLDDLTVEDIKKIMTEAKESPAEQYKNFFAIHRAELIIEPDVYDLIAQEVLKRESGARAITSVLHELLSDTLFHIPDENKQCFILNKDFFQSKFPQVK